MMLIYIDMVVSVYWPLSVLCVFARVCVYVCVISNQSTSIKPCYVSDPSKLDTFFHMQQDLSGTKVPRFHMCRSIMLLSIKLHIKCGLIAHSAKETRQQKQFGMEAEGKEGGVDKI